mgnify:CR=1 FL=1|tara:strand:- start:133 stop:348 length:216 start_codon:yes stop_codon:yes gene_type:complete
MSINKKGFIRKATEKKEVTDAPEDGDTKTERGVKYKRVAGKWKKVASDKAVYQVKKAKKSPGKIVERKNIA